MSSKSYLKSVILKEHSKKQCDQAVTYVGASPARFSQLVDLFLSGPYRATQRAAWPLSCCVQKHPKLMEPHLTKVLNYALQPGIHDAVKRNVVRLLQFIEIPVRLRGKTATICFQ